MVPIIYDLVEFFLKEIKVEINLLEAIQNPEEFKQNFQKAIEETGVVSIHEGTVSEDLMEKTFDQLHEYFFTGNEAFQIENLDQIPNVLKLEHFQSTLEAIAQAMIKAAELVFSGEERSFHFGVFNEEHSLEDGSEFFYVLEDDEELCFSNSLTKLSARYGVYLLVNN